MSHSFIFIGVSHQNSAFSLPSRNELNFSDIMYVWNEFIWIFLVPVILTDFERGTVENKCGLNYHRNTEVAMGIKYEKVIFKRKGNFKSDVRYELNKEYES